MNPRKIIVLALILLAGLIYVWRYEIGREPNPDALGGEAKSVIGEISAGDIIGLSVEIGPVSYGLTRAEKVSADPVSLANDGWSLNGVKDARISVPTIRAICEEISKLRSLNRISAEEVGKDLGAYGLEKPELKLSVKLKSGRSESLAFGKKHPLSLRRYLRVGTGAAIYLVDDSGFAAMRKMPEEVREHQPLKFDVAGVSEIVVSDRHGELERLAQNKGAPNQWSYTSGERKITADPKLVREILQSLSEARAKGFADNLTTDSALAKYALDNPFLKLAIHSGVAGDSGIAGDVVRQLSFSEVTMPAPTISTTKNDGRDDGKDLVKPLASKVYARVGGESVAYEIEKRVVTQLLQPAEHFLYKKPFDELALSNIVAIEVSRRTPNLEKYKLIRSSLIADNDSSSLSNTTKSSQSSAGQVPAGSSAKADWQMVLVGTGGELSTEEGAKPRSVSTAKVESLLKEITEVELISYLAAGEASAVGGGVEGVGSRGLTEPFLELRFDVLQGGKDGSAPVSSAATSGSASTAVAHYHFVIGNTLTTRTQQAGPNDSQAPRYGAIQVVNDGSVKSGAGSETNNGEFQNVVVSSADWTKLSKPYQFFNVE